MGATFGAQARSRWEGRRGKHFEFERALASVNAITVFVKFFKLTRIVMRLSLIVHVVSKAALHLLSWFVVAGMIFVVIVMPELA